MFVRQFEVEEEEEDSAVSALVEKSEAEYVFDGFDIEFSEKIALTPLTPRRGPVAHGQSVSRAFRAEPIVDKQQPQFGPPPAGNLIKLVNDARQKIIDLASGSAAARVRWQVGPGRELPPIGYIKGMALVYAKVYCKFKAGDAAAVEMAKASTGNAETDALARFASEFTAAGMSNDVAGADTLRHLFVLMMSHGMREAGGRYCEGRDRSVSNTGSDTAEAGLFQTSFVVRGAHSLMPQLFQQYKANPFGFLDVFKEGVTCTNNDLENFGTGDGKEFQRLTKASPAFAAEFAAVGLRNRCKHWGPIKNKRLEIRSEADDLFKQVQDLVDAEKLCPLL